MDSTLKMAELLRTLRRQTNGAVVEAMTVRGVDYPLSYGVAVPAIRQAATRYALDHTLALLLYRQKVRELQLAACYIADPVRITAEEASFWAAGITCSEIAEHVALTLGRSPAAEGIVTQWLAEDSTLLRYAALMCSARAALSEHIAGWDFQRLAALIEAISQTDDALLNRGITALLTRLWRHVGTSREHIDALIEKFRESRPVLREELLALRDYP